MASGTNMGVDPGGMGDKCTMVKPWFYHEIYHGFTMKFYHGITMKFYHGKLAQLPW